MKYPAADKALKVSETRASEKLRSAEASASKYPGARKPHSESGEFRCRKAVRGPILQGRENSPMERSDEHGFQSDFLSDLPAWTLRLSS
jgi:hypothetical protein